jgi:hypothetical protein
MSLSRVAFQVFKLRSELTPFDGKSVVACLDVGVHRCKGGASTQCRFFPHAFARALPVLLGMKPHYTHAASTPICENWRPQNSFRPATRFFWRISRLQRYRPA